MKMLIMMRTGNYLRDYNSDDLRELVLDGVVMVFRDKEHAEEALDELDIDYEEA